jgi:hypothetical protein
LDYRSKRALQALTKEQSELKRGPAQNRSEGFEGQGRIYKATHSAFFGAARLNKYHAMLIFGSSDMFPTAFPPVLHSLYVCGSVHVGRMLPSVLGNIGGKSVALIFAE